MVTVKINSVSIAESGNKVTTYLNFRKKVKFLKTTYNLAEDVAYDIVDRGLYKSFIQEKEEQARKVKKILELQKNDIFNIR